MTEHTPQMDPRRTAADRPVAVVIPNYDGTAALPDALESIAACSYPSEPIIVDNTGDDCVDELAAEFDATVVDAPPQSPAKNRNAGLDAVTAPYVTFLDVDDTLVPGALAKRVTALEQAAAAVAVCDVEHVDATGSVQSVGCAPRTEGPAAWLQAWRGDCNLVTHSYLMRTEVARVERYPEHLERSEDWHFGMRLLLNNDVVTVPEPLVRYHHHEGQRSGRDIQQRFREKRRAAIHLVSEYPDRLEPHAAYRKRMDWYQAARLALAAGDRAQASKCARWSLDVTPWQLHAWVVYLAAGVPNGTRLQRTAEAAASTLRGVI